MNSKLTSFLKIGLGIAKIFVPQIATVEDILKDGHTKKEKVVELIMVAPEVAEGIANKEIVDEALFKQGVAEVNDGYVKIMNSLKKD